MVLEVRSVLGSPNSVISSIGIRSNFSVFAPIRVSLTFLIEPTFQATMICIDNSEWMRNGDYTPSRFHAQAEAVNLICGAKTQVRYVLLRT